MSKLVIFDLDDTLLCTDSEFHFTKYIVKKGSIAINGVSLTVVNSSINSFSVAIIPYTYNYTNFKNLKPGDLVNIEFDMVGKYISKIIKDQS